VTAARHISRHAARPPLLAFLALILGLLAGPAAASPVVCTIGVSVESLHDLDMAGDSFGADLWLWTLCPASLPRAPLEKIEFPTAGQISRDPIEQTDLGDGRTYASQRLSGTFRFNWSMNSYPFDRQRVVIPITDSDYGADSLVFEPDTAESFLSHDVQDALPEWRITDFALDTGVDTADSAYGFPGGARDYAAADVRFTLERTSVFPFLKLTSGVLAAAFIAFFSFFYDPNEKGTFGGKLGLLVGVLFATLVNMRAADNVLGDIADLTLVTQIHLVTLVYIALLALLALRERRHVDRGGTLPHPRWRHLSLIGLSYVVVNALLVVRAMLS